MILVGATSWTEKSLVDSGWYPRGTRSPEGMLRYYAARFPITENDSLHYALPPPDRAARWVERTPKGFTMNVKAFATMTEHYTSVRQLPADIRAELKPSVRAKARVYPKDLGEQITAELARRFRESIEPLRAAGRLGLVLFQYPVWFNATLEHERQMIAAVELVPGCRVAVELRNAYWMTERHRERTLSVMREADIVYACVDEPQGFASSIPPIAEATTDIALVRLHGRSSTRWTRQAKAAHDRFRYFYTGEELREWAPRIRELEGETAAVHVLFNNCYSDYAVRNAREMTELLGVERERETGRREDGEDFWHPRPMT